MKKLYNNFPDTLISYVPVCEYGIDCSNENFSSELLGSFGLSDSNFYSAMKIDSTPLLKKLNDLREDLEDMLDY